MDFYAKFRELVFSRPRNALHSRAVSNCAFGDYIFRSKNTYVSYFLTNAEDCYYCDYVMNARDCVDGSYLSACELCYECVDCSGLYDCSFLQDCHHCARVDFSIDCLNCQDCFGCFGLRQQRFCLFNKNYPEEVYREKRASFKSYPPEKILEILRPEFEKHPRLFARLIKGGEQCLGDYVYFSKNCYQCFNVRKVEDAAYVSDIMDPEVPSRDCVDCTFASGIELCYECHNVHMCSNGSFLESCVGCSDCEYCYTCYSCRNCFGCVNLMHREYCVLNQQFTREEYLYVVAKIKNELKEAGLYGKTLAQILQ